MVYYAYFYDYGITARYNIIIILVQNIIRGVPSTVNDEKSCRVCNCTIFKYCNKIYSVDPAHAQRHRSVYRAIENQIRRMNTYDLKYSRYKHRKKSRLFVASTVYTV